MKILQTIWGIVFLLLLFSACTKEVGTYNEEIPKGNIIMKNLMPQRVSNQMVLEILNIEDSRCPLGEVCNSSGEVNLRFKTLVNGESEEITICFYNSKKTEDCTSFIKGHAINVVKVTPYPDANHPIKSILDYNVEISVKKVTE
jgi:hypothetical protein